VKNTTKAHLGLVVANLIYGANYLVAKGIMPGVIGPSGFILLRVTGACLVFACVLPFVGGFIKERAVWGRLILCAFFGVCANQLLFFNGLNLTSPINASIIMTVSPVLVLLLTALILKTKVPVIRWIGVAVGGLGAILLISSKSSSSNLVSFEGNTMVFFNAFSYSVYLLLVKPLMLKYNPLRIITHVFLLGWVMVLPFGFSQFMEVDWTGLTTNNYLSMLFVVLGTTVLCYALNIFSLKYVSPAVTSTYIYLQPVFSALVSYWYASYSGNSNYADLTPSKLVFTVLIFIGVYLVSKPKKQVGVDR